MYPSKPFPKFGSFVADSVEGLHRQGCDVRLAVQVDPGKGFARNFAKYAVLLGKGLVAGARGEFDVVHAHYLLPTGVIALIPARMRRKPLVVFFHGSDTLFADWRWPVGALARYVVASADRIVAPSKALKAEIIARFSADEAKIEVVPSGIDLDVFAPGSRDDARRTLGLQRDAKVLLFVGALDANKGEGCEDIIRAIASEEFADALSGVLLVVVGEGPRRDRLAQLAGALGLADRVSFGPFVSRSELVKYYRAADVVVIPSRRESLGLVSLEAQASGVPVVATAVGGLVEHLEPGVGGEFYEPGDISGLARALLRVLSNPASYDPAARRADFADVRAAERLVALNRVLLGEGAVRA